MSPCDDVRRRIEAAWQPGEVAAGDLAHAEGCARCATALERQRSLSEVIERARGALAVAGELPPSSWVRIRQGVDAAAARARVGGVTPLRAVLWGGTVALAVAVVLSQWPTGADPGPAWRDGRAVGALDAAWPLAPRLERRWPVFAEGDLIEADSAAPLELTAFGQHRIGLAAGTAALVRAWTPRLLELELLAGSLQAEVARVSDDARFAVVSGDVVVSVRGTAFTVTRLAGATTVSVSRGRVAVDGPVGGPHEGRELGAGESATFADVVAEVDGAGADLGAAPISAERARRPVKPRFIQINVPDQEMTASPMAAEWGLEGALHAIEEAVDAGRCEGAMNALDALMARAPRGAVSNREAALLRERCRTTVP